MTLYHSVPVACPGDPIVETLGVDNITPVCAPPWTNALEARLRAKDE